MLYSRIQNIHLYGRLLSPAALFSMNVLKADLPPVQLRQV